MKEIVLVPYAGLCNRMNALMSGIALLENRQDVKLKIYWPKDKDCYAYFSELFKPISIDRFSLNKLRNPFWNFASKRNLYIPYYLRKMLGMTQRCGKLRESDEPVDNWLNNRDQQIYISAANRFNPYIPKVRLRDIFVPIDEITKKIESISQQYSEHTVGIHVRRTDNAAAIKNSPLDLFFEHVDVELKQYPNAKFYLASDDNGVKEEFVNRYGNKIIIGNWTLKRNSVQGMQDAVAELFCLSKTCKILGSTHSTYSIVAAGLNEIPLIVVKR